MTYFAVTPLAAVLPLLTAAGPPRTITLEAETAAAAPAAAPWVRSEDDSAAGGAYAAVPLPAGGPTGRVPVPAGGGVLAFPFTLTEPSPVRVFAAVKRLPGPHADEVYDRRLEVRIDGGPWADWTIENLDRLAWNWNAHDDPAWAQRAGAEPGDATWAAAKRARFGPLALWENPANPLAAGPHTLEIRHREAGVALDRVVVTTDPDHRPPHPELRRGVLFHDGFEGDFRNWL